MGEESKKKKSLKEKAQDLCVKMDKERKEANKLVMEVVNIMEDIEKVANQRNIIYRNRKNIADMKVEAMDIAAWWNKLNNDNRESIYTSYKLGKKVAKDGSGLHAKRLSIKPSNEFERKLYLDSDTSTIQYVVGLINNHVTHLIDCMKSIDDMIYGIDHVINLEEWATNRK